VAAGDDPAAAQLFPAAIAALRELSSPYHLGEGLLDYAEYLASTGQAAAGNPLIDETQQIASQLGARPLATRAEAVRVRVDRQLVPGQPAPSAAR
jgi:hypothetical protein